LPPALQEHLLDLRRQCDLGQQREDEACGVLVGEAREGHVRGVALAAGPAGVPLIQLGSRGAHDEDGHLRCPVDQVVDEGDQRLVRPVQVLEDEDERAARRDRLQERAPGGERLAAIGRFRRHADEPREARLDPLDLQRITDHGLDGHGQLRAGLVGPIGLEDAGLALDHLAQGPVRDALAVREAAALAPRDDDARVVVDDRPELPEQARLAGTRLAGDGHELDGGLIDGPLEGGAQQRQFGAPPEEGGRRALVHVDAVAAARGQRLPDGHWFRLTLERDGFQLPVLDHVARGPAGELAHHHAALGGDGLEPRRGVDDVAGHDALAPVGPAPDGHHRLPGVHADAHGQVQAWALLVQLGHGIEDAQGGTDAAFGVVLVRDRRAEDGHDGVADELLDRAAEALDLPAQSRVVRVQKVAHVLRVGALGTRGEADEVAEEDRDDLALLHLGRRLRGQRRRTVQAEPGSLRVLLAAGRAGEHPRSLRAAVRNRKAYMVAAPRGRSAPCQRVRCGMIP